MLRKAPADNAPFAIDWTNFLLAEGTTLSTSSWALISGDVVLGTSQISGTIAKINLSGGTVSTTSKLRNTITTANSRTFTMDLEIQVKERS